MVYGARRETLAEKEETREMVLNWSGTIVNADAEQSPYHGLERGLIKLKVLVRS